MDNPYMRAAYCIVQMGTVKKTESSLGGLEPPTFRLTAERANRLRHRDSTLVGEFNIKYFFECLIS